MRISDWSSDVCSSDLPLTPGELKLHVGEAGDLAAALAALSAHYAGRGVNLVERGGRWHFQTAGDLSHILRREKDETRKLSRAAMEPLALIAYHEPVSRAEIEAIRGVQVGSEERREGKEGVSTGSSRWSRNY